MLTGMLWMTGWALGGQVVGTVEVKGRLDGPVVIYLDAREGDPPPPEPDDDTTIREKGRQFLPGGEVVQAGSTVTFSNQDNVTHHVYSLTPDQEFEIREYPNGEKRTVKFHTAGVVDIFCNIHANMRTRILVLPNPWFTRLESEGSFTLEDLPPGPRAIHVWSAGHEPLVREVVIPEEGAIELGTLSLVPAPPPLRIPLDVDGDGY